MEIIIAILIVFIYLMPEPSFGKDRRQVKRRTQTDDDRDNGLIRLSNSRPAIKKSEVNF